MDYELFENICNRYKLPRCLTKWIYLYYIPKNPFLKEVRELGIDYVMDDLYFDNGEYSYDINNIAITDIETKVTKITDKLCFALNLYDGDKYIYYVYGRRVPRKLPQKFYESVHVNLSNITRVGDYYHHLSNIKDMLLNRSY